MKVWVLIEHDSLGPPKVTVYSSFESMVGDLEGAGDLERASGLKRWIQNRDPLEIGYHDPTWTVEEVEVDG